MPLKLTITVHHQLLPCWICDRLNHNFIAQTVHRATLDNGMSRIYFPLCVEHQWRLTAEEINDILEA